MKRFLPGLKREHSVQEEITRLQKPIDHLVALADQVESNEVALEADRIIAEMKEDAESRAAHFRQLGEIALLAKKEPVFEPVVCDTAEILLKEIKEKPATKHDIGISAVWSAAHAWDEVRTNEATTQLLEQIIDAFPGGSKETLRLAFNRAKSDDLSFTQALDLVNEELYQAA